MYYFISFLFLLSFNIYLLPLNFFKSNSSFLNSHIKQIKCDYAIYYSDQMNIGEANLIMDDNHYRLSLNDRLIISDTQVMQTYFKSNNQIFIENASIGIDTLILNFFNYFKSDFKNDFFIKDSSRNFLKLFDGNSTTIQIFSDFNTIDSLYISTDDIRNFNLSLYDIELLSIPYSHDTLFTINQPDAFILDLRD